MSWHAIDVAYQTSDGLTAPEAAVYHAYAYHANREGKAYPSVAMLCRETRYSQWTVRKAIRSLEAKGRIKVQRLRGTALPVHLTALPLLIDRANPARQNPNRTNMNRATTRATQSCGVAENQSSAGGLTREQQIELCPYCDERGWIERGNRAGLCTHEPRRDVSDLRVPEDLNGQGAML